MMSPIEMRVFADEADLLSRCAPIFFVRNEIIPDDICANGTVALMDTGSRRILTTCDHVWEEFIAFRSNNPKARLCVILSNGFAAPVEITEGHVVDRNQDLDLVTFAVEPGWSQGSKQFQRIHQWPIPKARPRDHIAFLGFAGTGRYAKGLTGNFRYDSFGLTVSDVSDRKLVCARDNGRKLQDNGGKEIPAKEIGGLSGSPAYILKSNGCFQLCAFVQMGKSSHSDIFLTHAWFLNPDGSIRC